MVSLRLSDVTRTDQVAEEKRIIAAILAGPDFDRVTKIGSVVDKRVELAVFSARVDTLREFCKKVARQISTAE